jgi:hypothetical protein
MIFLWRKHEPKQSIYVSEIKFDGWTCTIDWINYMCALCPKAMMWILLLMQTDPARWNSLWKNEIIRWNFMLFQNEIGFIHELLPIVLFHPWKCIQGFFCPWDFM